MRRRRPSRCQPPGARVGSAVKRLLLRALLLALAVRALHRIAALAEVRLGVVLHARQAERAGGACAACRALAAAGHLVERPEMCWSARRIYDRPYLECLRRDRRRDRTAAAARRHSIRGRRSQPRRQRCARLWRAAPTRRRGGAGARTSAGGAGAAPSDCRQRSIKPASWWPKAARKLGCRFRISTAILLISVTTTPETYLSFFAPDSPAVMPANAARLQAPLLYVVGTGDPLQRGPDEIFAKAPPHPLNRYVTVRAGHFDTSAAAADAVVAWLRALCAITVTTPAGSAPPPPR